MSTDSVPAAVANIRVHNPTYNILPREQWQGFAKIGIERAIRAIFAIAEFNRTCPRPILIPAEYISLSVHRVRWVAYMPAWSNNDWMPLSTATKPSADNKIKAPVASYNGYVLAGGAALRTVFGFDREYSEMDADYYPYSEAGYEQWLRDFDSYAVRVERGEYNTTVYGRKQHGATETITKHQIIHRLYKQPWEVVCGFDQPCCKVFYDGTGTYMTLDCALCIMYQITPVDWRAESPPHIIRALKYERRGFRPVVPRMPVGQWRFGAGVVTVLEARWQLGTHDYKYLNPRDGIANLEFSNPGEFPPLQVLDSAYASDYDLNTPRGVDDANLYPCAPTIDIPRTGKQSLADISLRAAAHGLPEYYLVEAPSCTSMLAGDFKKIDIVEAVDAQPYHRWWMHRTRMLELQAEANQCMNRRMIPNGYDKRKKKDKLAKFQIHRAGDMVRLAEICAESKTLYEEYVRAAEQRAAEYTERRKVVQFLCENPGAQNNASFNPVKRASHSAYWGACANVPTYDAIAWHGIRYIRLLSLRGVINRVPKDVIGLIRMAAYMGYIEDLAAIGCANHDVDGLPTITVGSDGRVGGVAIGHNAVASGTYSIAIGRTV